MSVTGVRVKGGTVVTVVSNMKSMFPPLCQILKTLCYSPMCCSEYKGLMQPSVTAALGTIQIMVGIFNIGPGCANRNLGILTSWGDAYFLGAMFIAAGIMSILAGQYPSLCLVGFTVLINLLGSAFAMVGIVLYGMDLGDVSVTRMCDNRHNYYDDCRYVRLLMAVDITLIVLAVLQLCVSISVAFLGMRALDSFGKEKGGKDADFYQPALKEEVFMISPRV
ncbi:uncharacterized protein LOC108899475 [Lates calcarifer]|uniref:Uncharacterized protein LOC108899475 n=1 Tax=Lates calcarifer TaxID=8187 RepID=A0AAJ7VIC0_LATCA|nr:uncharacterized protein LOC108899475 [Lates calcarifer]